MTKQVKTPRSASTQSNEIARTGRNGSRPHTVSASGAKNAVTPTSERIIRQTSVKRRKAMKVLASR